MLLTLYRSSPKGETYTGSITSPGVGAELHSIFIPQVKIDNKIDTKLETKLSEKRQNY
jgi:hypothetical protein